MALISRYTSCSIDLKFGDDCCSPKAATYHYVDIQDMRRLHALIHGMCLRMWHVMLLWHVIAVSVALHQADGRNAFFEILVRCIPRRHTMLPAEGHFLAHGCRGTFSHTRLCFPPRFRPLPSRFWLERRARCGAIAREQSDQLDFECGQGGVTVTDAENLSCN